MPAEAFAVSEAPRLAVGTWVSGGTTTDYGVKAQGAVYNAMGAGRSAPIAPEDVAAVAAKILTSPDGLGQVLVLTGDELLTVPEQVEILSRALGNPSNVSRSRSKPPSRA